ncbi:hypothetical protein [Amycolatopsis sp. cg9]|uniref:hypothetical protein n=1 Tax=Amycolatopsis sp. cg9 TaxID=3238801 RepID=UPI003523C648
MDTFVTVDSRQQTCSRTEVTLNDAAEGQWPRPRAQCAVDLDLYGDALPDRPQARPRPWLAASSGDGNRAAGWDPWKFDHQRAHRMRSDDLCQVCGTSRSDVVYVLAPAHRLTTMVEMYGGAVCSLKCARLTAAVCPHYTTAGSPTLIYAVPRHERVDLVGCDLDNDDEYDVSGIVPTASISIDEARRLC